ncbi:hypothetical protein BDR05DRAFT_978783 [Suillus weaverae]|nr:hypothetical protein BDR05DRAFT_978783 [Suillus weaverae]
MFADDTTIYLTSKDNFTTLTKILTKWCKASGAKFDKTKTEVIPIGPKPYCQNLIESRKLNNNSTMIPEDVNINKDRTATRILGAWVGNETNEHNIWSPMIEKIDTSLKRWERCHSTVEGRKIIIQCIIEGMTQYLTVAHRKPKEVKKALITKARNFIWDNKGKSSVSLDILCAQIDIDSKNMLHLTH